MLTNFTCLQKYVGQFSFLPFGTCLRFCCFSALNIQIEILPTLKDQRLPALNLYMQGTQHLHLPS